MPQIAPVPIDEPVARPRMSPAQAGSAGETVAGLGAESAQLAISAESFEGYLLGAQRQLKYKQAKIAFDAANEQLYNDISKAVTSEQVDSNYEHHKDNLNKALAPFETDRVLARELGIYRQQEDNEIRRTMNGKKAEIVTKADHAANDVNEEKTLQQAVADKIGGGDPTVARTEHLLNLKSSEAHGTLLPQQVDEKMYKWDKEYESRYIDAQLSSPNLQTIQNTVNELRLHPEKYPHLDKAETNALAIKGENAIVSMMSRQDEINAKAEEGKYWNQSATGIPKLFTDKDGNFDGGKAESYVASLGLSPAGEKLLLGDIKTHDAASNLQLKENAIKLENEIVEAGNHHDYKKSAALLEQFKSFSNQHPELGEMFKGMSNYIDEKKSREMSLAIEGMRVQTEAAQLQMLRDKEQSFATFGQLGPDIAKGKYTDTQLRLMTGGGTGKLQNGQMLHEQVEEAIRLNHASDTDPENKKYINSIWNDTALPTPAQGRIVGEFQTWLRKYPGASEDAKAAEVKRLIDPVHVEQINDALDNILNQQNQPKTKAKEPLPEISLPEDYAGGVELSVQRPKKRTPPPIGTVIDGHEYQGGDPSDRANWPEVEP